MTYLNFLLLFVVLPSFILTIIFRCQLTRRWLASVGLLALIAVVWTTPWDNYLVATRVWWYEPELVLGIIFGYVPLEEYSFFVLQTVLTGVLLAGLVNWFPQRSLYTLPLHIRLIPAVVLAAIVLLLVASGDQRFKYLILTIGWLALIPLAIQWAFGLDILLQRWQALALGILISTLWLTGVDTLAIGAGTWTIDPAQTVGVLLPGGVVPLEEGVFFLLTNALIVQGLLLANAPESLSRVMEWRARLSNRRDEAAGG